MANPFEAFRKYQAVMLAVFGVLIVIVFTVGDSLTQMAGGGGGGTVKDPVVVTWVGGDVRRSELDIEINKRAMVGRTIYRLQLAAFQNSNFPESFLDQIMKQPRFANRRIVTQQSLNPDATFQYMLLLRKADQLDIHVSDDEVFGYLDLLTQSPMDGKPQFSRAEMNDIIQGPPGNRHGSSKAFFELVRNELKATAVRNNLLLRGGFQNVPPGEKLAYYRQVEKQIDAELIAVPVDQFVGQVSDPSSQSELEKYFLKYKADLPTYRRVGGTQLPTSAPGFKQPYKVEIEFIRFSHDEFVDRAREEIEKDEAKILAFYERHKDTDPKLQVSDVEADAAEGDAAEATEEEGEEAEAKEETEGDTDTEAGTDADTGADAEAAKDAASDSSSPEAAGEPAATTEEDTAKTAEEILADTDADSATDEETGDDKKDDEEEKVKYRPFDEVRDYIVQQLAAQRAAELIDETISPLQDKMRGFSQYVKKGEGRSLEKIAAGTGLTVHRIGPFSDIQFRDTTEIGKVPRFLRSLFLNKGKATLRNAVKISDYENNNYLFWKIAEVDEKELTLSEFRNDPKVRAEVTQAWKLGEGREDAADTAQTLAVAAANKMAEKLRGGAAIADVAQGQTNAQIVPTGFFSWFSLPAAPDPQGFDRVSLSSIEGVDSPGPEFMKTAFGLGVGEVGVALNYPRTMAYVIRVNEVRPDEDKLRTDFLEKFKSSTLPSGVGVIAQYELAEAERAWYEELNAEFKVERPEE